MMGYATGAYALGYYGDLEDPITAVRPDLDKQGFGSFDDAGKKLHEEVS
jgi:hypothetical protein